MQKLNITIKGVVQGVFFRQSTKAVADQLGIRGWIRNMEDGSVYVEAEGDELIMKSFLDWCKEGPDRAVVESVDYVISEPEGFKNFIIKK